MRKITGDPLTDYPDFVEVLTPRIEDWRDRQLCLCGCGGETRVNGRTGMPYYLKSGHYNMLYKQAGVKLPIIDSSVKAKTAPRNRWTDLSISSFMLAEEVKEYCRVNDISVYALAGQAGVDRGWLWRVVKGRKNRVTKKSMILVMEAMGKSVHPSLVGGYAERVCIWCGNSFLGHVHGKTCSSECRHAKWGWEQNGGKSAADLELAREYGV